MIPALRRQGRRVIAASRNPPADEVNRAGVEWRRCDLEDPRTVTAALADIDLAYYLVHSMGTRARDFRSIEREAAASFAEAAAAAGVRRIVYLGGPEPADRPSAHLESRLEVGRILRAGIVPTIELRASMVVGASGAAWQIVRDLSMRLPLMVLPRWLESRTCPVALEDAIAALLAAADISLTSSKWFDIPGPDTLSGREILERIAAVRGRRILALEVPLLTPRLSALWLKLVTSADFRLARELVVGLSQDLLPKDAHYWKLIGHEDRVPFELAARRALALERPPAEAGHRLAAFEEHLVDLAGPRA